MTISATCTEMYLVQSSLQVRGPSGQDRVSGQESIAGLWKSATKGVARFEFTVTSAALTDGAITDRGTFVFKAKDGKMLNRGSYTGVWRREGPVWKIARHEVTVEPPRSTGR